jgi:uncharacterized caspase-like protein
MRPHAGRPTQWFIVVLLASLVACVAPTPSYVKADDPFKPFDANRGARFKDLKLAFLVSDNTRIALQHVADTERKSFGFASYPEMDPGHLVADILQVLQAQFKEVHKVDSVEQARTIGADLVTVLDLRIQVGIPGVRGAVTQVASDFHTLEGAPIDTIVGSGTETSILYDGRYMFAKNWKIAVGEFGTRLGSSAKLQAFAGGRKPVDAELEAALPVHPPQAAPGSGEPVNGKAPFGDYYALVVGNDAYLNVTPLKTAGNDAQAVAALLTEAYGFKVKLLLNATRTQMLDAFDEYRQTLRESDNLLIYYAGHGYLDSDSDRGYWIPVDADNHRRANWLSNSDVADTVRAVRANHVLVIADSCYSGTLTRGLSVMGTAVDDYTRLAQKRARTALSSGGLEPVEDAGGGGHSVFAKAFLAALAANKGVEDMSDIFPGLRREVMLASPQTPRYGDIRQAGHDGGDFIFVKLKGKGDSKVPNSPEAGP